MTVLARIQREPAALFGAVVAITGLLMLFGVPLTVEQAGGILTLAGALVALLRYVLTPSSEVVAQARPDGTVVAGAAAAATTGAPVTVEVYPSAGDGGVVDHRRRRDEAGAAAVGLTAAVAIATTLIAVMLVLVMLLPSSASTLRREDPVPDRFIPKAAQPCAQEDSPGPCYWDAGQRGNGRGKSYVVKNGRIYYVDGTERRAG